MRESVRENPRRSISHRSQELGLSATSIWRILRRDLGLHPYKIQLTQELKVNDHRQRRVFALIGFWSSWKLTQISPNKSSLAMRPFWMNGYVNKQNCRIWDDTNPREIHQLQMHPEKVTVWCGF